MTDLKRSPKLQAALNRWRDVAIDPNSTLEERTKAFDAVCVAGGMPTLTEEEQRDAK